MLTVCLLTRDRPLFLAEALHSLMIQSQHPARVVVCDSGSRYDVQGLVSLFPKVEFRGSDIPRPEVWNLGRAVDLCETPYIYIMHDDDLLHRDFVERQMRMIHQGFVAVGANARMIRETGEPLPYILNPVGLPTYYNNPATLAAIYARGWKIPYPSMIYRTDIFRRVRPLVGPYGCGRFNDFVTVLEMSKQGVIGYENRLLWAYRRHDGQDSHECPPISDLWAFARYIRKIRGVQVGTVARVYWWAAHRTAMVGKKKWLK